MERRNAYEDKLRAQVEEWNAKLDQLRAKASQADADTRIEIQERIRELEKARENAQGELEALTKVGEDAWDKAKKKADDAVATVERKLSEALEKLG